MSISCPLIYSFNVHLVASGKYWELSFDFQPSAFWKIILAIITASSISENMSQIYHSISAASVKLVSTLTYITSNNLASDFFLSLSPSSHPFPQKQPNLNCKSNSIISCLEVLFNGFLLEGKNSKLLALAPKSALFWLLLAFLNLTTSQLLASTLAFLELGQVPSLSQGLCTSCFLSECLVLGFSDGSI